jgi:hypothetical protein
MTGVFGAAARSSFDVALLDTFASASYRELDYVHEGKNQDRMAAAVRHPPQARHVHPRLCLRLCRGHRVSLAALGVNRRAPPGGRRGGLRAAGALGGDAAEGDRD